MAIFGEFRVEIPKQTLRNMKIGHPGFIFTDNFILSKNLLCIELDTEVFYKIEDVIGVDNYVAIYRLAEGNIAESFDIDLNEDHEFSIKDFYLDPGAITQQYAKSMDWICFKNPPIFYDIVSYDESMYTNANQSDQEVLKIGAILDPVVISNLNLKELNQKLITVVKKEDYELAAKIRDEIYRKENLKK